MNRQFDSISRGLALLAALASLALSAPLGRAQIGWNDDAPAALSDVHARKVGDLLTVIIQENRVATKNTQTKTAKTSGIDAGVEAFLYPPAATGLLTKRGRMPALKLNSSSNFEGGGNISSSERITSRISVRILDVLPNRHFIVEGAQTTSFGGDTQEVVLRGVVREQDITPQNSVFSYNLADVTIRMDSSGSISDSSKRGWFTTVWDKISPF